MVLCHVTRVCGCLADYINILKRSKNHPAGKCYVSATASQSKPTGLREVEPLKHPGNIDPSDTWCTHSRHLERFLRSVGDSTRSSSALSDAVRPCFPRVVRRVARAATLLAPPAWSQVKEAVILTADSVMMYNSRHVAAWSYSLSRDRCTMAVSTGACLSPVHVILPRYRRCGNLQPRVNHRTTVALAVICVSRAALGLPQASSHNDLARTRTPSSL